MKNLEEELKILLSKIDEMESNKLIAEFMGMNIHHNDKSMMVRKTLQGNEVLYIDKLEYHSSWDWLMPVINKIRSMDSTYEVEEVGKYDWDNEISHYEFDLDLTYESVVEFINQLNNNNNE